MSRPQGRMVQSMTEERFFHELQDECERRFRGKDRATLRALEECLGDVVAVMRSVIPNSQGTEEAPFIMTVCAIVASVGLAARAEIERQQR